MTRRLPSVVVTLAAVAVLVLSACGQSATPVPVLTDPKDILAQSISSLKDVKTATMTGTFTGTVTIPSLGSGSLDLSTTKFGGAIDIPNKKAQVSLDAPAFLSTKADAILVDNMLYYEVDGLLAGQFGLTAGKYTALPLPQASGQPAAADPSAIAKSVDDFRTQLDKLPSPPTKGADEACGDQTCYHVTIALTAADIAKMNPSSASTFADGSVTIDVWSRKNDLRPAKISFSITNSQIGTIGINLAFTYDGTVTIVAPSPGDILPAGSDGRVPATPGSAPGVSPAGSPSATPGY